MDYLEKAQQEGVPLEELVPIDLVSYEELVRKIQSQPKQQFISTGSNDLDELMGGFEGGRLYALSAPTKMGKTTWAMTTMFEMSKKGIPSLFFSYEMGWQEVAKKFLAMDKITNPSAPTSLPMFIPMELHRQGGKLQYQWLFDSIAKAKQEKGIKLVVIDHLHFLLPLKDYQNTSFIIGGIVREIKRMAVALDIPIILICHVQKLKDDKIPDWTDIRDSSFITQEADVTLMLYRVKQKEAPRKITDDAVIETYTQKAILSLELDRVNGRSGKIALWHNGAYFEKFTEAHDLNMQMQKIYVQNDAKNKGAGGNIKMPLVRPSRGQDSEIQDFS